MSNGLTKPPEDSQMLTRKSTLEWSFARDDEEWQKFETALSSKTNVAATQIGFWYKNRAYLMLLVVALMGFVLREAYTWQKTRTLQAMQEDEVRSAIEMDLLAVHNDGQIVTLNLVDEHADERWKQKNQPATETLSFPLGLGGECSQNGEGFAPLDNRCPED